MSAAPTTAPARTRRTVTPDSTRLWGLMAEFDSPEAIFTAAERTRDAGYRWWDCCTPFPVHGLDKAMGIKPTILPILVFFAGATGVVIGILLQWFTNGTSFDVWALVWVRGYDYIISGKPMSSVPAWAPVIFELMVLFAALTTVGLMLLLNGLPRLYHPTLKSARFARATNDRFFLVVEARDPRFSLAKTEAFLNDLNPLSLERLEA
ncbi:MAG: DUF3341 domain-containing protein [Phycisphaerales bacterium]|nr:DUF3341 domain-containing protein [Phycisphaerae bacterium]NNF41646.1 DUF3341 domain-containing protein [Phycisphaerales bacterium]NNM27007.1 DUF3341 domain-containing protein [Phycisphaerales bacterium]